MNDSFVIQFKPPSDRGGSWPGAPAMRRAFLRPNQPDLEAFREQSAPPWAGAGDRTGGGGAPGIGQRAKSSHLLEQLTTPGSVGILSNMKAELLYRERLALSRAAFVEMVVWQVAQPLIGSAHDFKYRLALMSEGVCVLRYDNEVGKGDHKHVGGREVPYCFVDIDALQADFWADVEEWRQRQ